MSFCNFKGRESKLKVGYLLSFIFASVPSKFLSDNFGHKGVETEPVLSHFFANFQIVFEKKRKNLFGKFTSGVIFLDSI